MGWSQEFMYRDCPWCRAVQVQMEPIFVDATVETGGGHYRTWAAVTCPRCGGLVGIETNPPHPEYADAVRRVIPESDTQTTIQHLPSDVERYFRGGVTVLRAGVPDAAAVQLRKTLEAAAKHVGVTTQPLVKAVQQMIDDGLITKGFAAVLDHIRVVGNAGAHAGAEEVDLVAAERAMRFTVQVLRNLFEIPGELGELDSGTLTTELDTSASSE
jgi:hypothetical protein